MKLRILLVTVAIAFAAAADVHGAFDTYIRTVPALDGEVSSPPAPAGFANAWGIFSFSIGVSNPTTLGTGGGGLSAGRPSFSSLNVMKALDKASVMSLLKLAQGNHFDSVTLSCVNSSTHVLLYEIKLETVFFEGIQHSGSAGGDDRPTESVSFAYGKITWTYYPPSGSPIIATWDLTTLNGQ